MKAVSLTVVRRGDTVAAVKGAHHCGTAQFCTAVDGSLILPVRWVFQAICTPDSLDSRGFAFDQSRLDDLVHRVARREARDSCERLACDLGHAFVVAVARENPVCRIHDLTVTVSPAPYLSDLSARFVWDRGDV